MSELVLIADVHVPENRLRRVKDDFAALYARAITAGRTLPPVQVRRTPNGKAKFTLVSGAHRLKAHEIAGRTEIAAEIVALDKDEAREAEIEENLFRNDLTALERIDAVAAYRVLFEEKYGKIARGNPELANCAKFAELDLLGNVEDSQEGNFFARVKELLGLSRRSVELCSTIARTLCPQLHDVLTGSPLEDNQAVIQRLARLDLGTQIVYANTLRTNGGDIAAADAAFYPKPVRTRDERAYDDMVDGWTRTNMGVRRKFVADHLTAILPMTIHALEADTALCQQFLQQLPKEALQQALAPTPAQKAIAGVLAKVPSGGDA